MSPSQPKVKSSHLEETPVNPEMKAMLDAIAKASSQAMESADKPQSNQCPNCGHPIEPSQNDHDSQPRNDQEKQD